MAQTPEERRAANKRWRDENPERHLENSRRWYRENREYALRRNRERRKNNREEYLRAQATYREQNRERISCRAFQKKYDLTRAEVLFLTAFQGNKCALCGGEFSGTGNKGTAPVVDHDHSTKQYRGIIHNKCNTSIGKLGDTLEGVEKALAYLKQAERKRVLHEN